MTIDRAIEILDKWEFFYGQRAGRELWADKSTEVQDEDIANFCRDLGLVREALERTRWIPVSERLPEDGQYVLCWYQYFRYGNYNRLWQTYGIGFQYNGNWGGEVSTGRDTKVLFWMPLPEPPEEVQRKEDFL